MLSKVLLIVFSIVLSLFICEFVLRVYDSLLRWQYPGEEGEESLFWEHDSLLGWKLKPNGAGYFTSRKNRFHILVKTNSKGLRDNDHEYRKVEGINRILLLGDSVTAGFEVEKDKVIDTRLEHYLSGHNKYEVINAGFRGYGTDQLYLWLMHEGYKYQPDIVIYIFYHNDPLNNVTIHYPGAKFGKPYFLLHDKDKLVLNGVPVPTKFEPFDKHLTSDREHQYLYDDRLKKISSKSKEKKSNVFLQFHLGRLITEAFVTLERTVLMKHVLVKLKLSKWENLDQEDPAPLLHRWRITKAIVQNMKLLTDDIGAKFLVYESTSGVANPVFFSLTPLKQLSNELGVNYLSSFREFYEMSQGKNILRFPYDDHWNARGHDLAAKLLYEYLRKNKWL